MSHDPLVAELLGRAFHVVPAMRANEEISRMREQRFASHGGRESLSYELLLPAENERAFLLEKALPKLIYFLDCRGVRSSAAEEVFLSLFAGDQLCFVHLADLIAVLGPAAGLSFDEMIHRWGENQGQ